jgi:8-oxo-dGTP pyrophosphatase MutT (NUDIX family)
MAREISAGGVVIKPGKSGREIAVIEPQKGVAPAAVAKPQRKTSQKMLLALPKGLVDAGEKPQETAIREVFEETGVEASLITKLGDIKYTYVRSWGDKTRVFKIVSFYLLRYEAGRIDEIDAEMRIEVKRALWIALEEAVQKLAYRGEKDMVRRAIEYLEEHPDLTVGGP